MGSSTDPKVIVWCVTVTNRPGNGPNEGRVDYSKIFHLY
jgi:hypothetical protein